MSQPAREVSLGHGPFPMLVETVPSIILYPCCDHALGVGPTGGRDPGQGSSLLLWLAAYTPPVARPKPFWQGGRGEETAGDEGAGWGGSGASPARPYASWEGVSRTFFLKQKPFTFI